MSGLFGGKPKAPKPVTMPDEQGPAMMEARRQRQRELLAASGRSSTNLTGQQPGGGDYGKVGL